jgi:glycosyltransferase involved in cell wall biosynthesis
VELVQGLSVVCPVYCSEQTLGRLVEEICLALSNQTDFEIILVDDQSKDGSWNEIVSIGKVNSHVRGIKLGRNVGQHGALLAGVREARFQITVTLDDDLQNPPSEIFKVLDPLKDGVDVVYGVSSGVRQSFSRRFASRFAKALFQIILGFDHATEISSFRAFRTELRNGFSNDLGPNISLDSLLTWSTTSFISVEVRHDKRSVGKSNYNIRSLFKFMFDTATGYSTVPLKFATMIGSIVTLLGLLMFLWVTIRPVVTGVSVPGFPLLASSLAIFSGTQLLMLGILGEYIGKMHFRVMNKPTYLISQRTGSSE